ncbi:Hypothetical predicted protein [Octopus vulgaris]|uniref:Uncharacterized protein n=1 Tax=Octopus vulgaris TaxID=6645 RepID=A0AA36B4L3_OCTVU|nr:Hypothetical predicted protein [Octopus vulgaris]
MKKVGEIGNEKVVKKEKEQTKRKECGTNKYRFTRFPEETKMKKPAYSLEAMRQITKNTIAKNKCDNKDTILTDTYTIVFRPPLSPAGAAFREGFLCFLFVVVAVHPSPSFSSGIGVVAGSATAGTAEAAAEAEVDLASMPARSVGDQVACWFPEVSVADHKTIRIAELQQPGSLLVAGTITVASMYAMEAPSMSSNMPIEITSHKEKVPVVRR